MAEKSLAERKRNTRGLQSWLNDIAAYERAFKAWESRSEKIVKRYRDDPRAGRQTWTDAKFNVLWSNVQTLTAATFSRLPKPDVSRRFRDQDPVGRVASMILERNLEYHVQHYPQYASMLGCAMSRTSGPSICPSMGCRSRRTLTRRMRNSITSALPAITSMRATSGI